MSDDNFVIDTFNFADPNLQGWDGQGGGPPEVPPGEYKFELVSLTSKSTNANDGRNLVATWKIVEGDYEGKEIMAWYLYQGAKFKTGHARRIVQVFRDALGVPMAENGAWETKDAVGKRMWGTVAHEPSTKKGKYDPATGVTAPDKEFINANISCERAVEEAAEAPPPPAPSAPAPRPPAAPPPRANGAAAKAPPPAPPRR